MGDRCYLAITLRNSDLNAFGKAAGFVDGEEWWDDVDDGDPGAAFADGRLNGSPVTLIVEEANYAWLNELQDAAAAGIPFYGYHGSGSEYTHGVFASDGENYDDMNTTDTGLPYIEYDLETGEPVNEAADLEYLREYRDLYLRAREIVSGIPAVAPKKPLAKRRKK